MTSPSHTQISRRASNHQPVHRRPFYGKNARSFDAYTSDTRRRTYMRPLGAVIDAGLDNFSYDPDYLQPFKMPDGLSELLPDELRGDARVWQLSAAALETSLQRIDKLYQCATDFAFPPKTRPDLIHANSLPILERERADTPPLSFTWLDHSSITARLSPLPITVPDLDTPPLTPVVTNSSGDEILSERTSLNDVILSEPRSATCSLSSWDVPPTASASTDDFDEMSWEIYLRRYHANLDDVHEAHRRLKGYGRRINTLCSELSHSGTASAKSTLLELMRWWGPMERVQTEDFDRRVAEIDTPDVNLVRMEWQSMHR